ncbi:glycosyltransferase family 2 protein [Methyloligella sp. 2.7D]|uniref:glycosyltransferase family 2 protein n=1 Tax=unclassified Methyloligella TaxID=2625955 RepID=UPI00157D9510|nr:glycosyltransferase family 2 protein [Methyloligella sp. GL2]QKP78497.1 glycosyltransferase [Methyloligella sp. GL2]
MQVARHAPALPGGDSRRLTRSQYDFLLGRLIDRATLARAQALALRWGVAPHEVLIANGWISAEDYTRALAAFCGVGFVPETHLDAVPARSSDRPKDCLRAGLLRQRGMRQAVFAPEQMAPMQLRRDFEALGGRVCFAASQTVRGAIRHHFAPELKHEASEALFERFPDRSAKSPVALWMRIALALGAILLAAGLIFAFAGTVRALSLLMVIAFVPVIGLRIAALWHFTEAAKTEAPPARMADAALPAYSLLVPLLREAKVLPRLAHNLSRLDYPAAKLDIKLILEAGDLETIAMARALDLPGNFEIVIVPSGFPQTKPKALNYALPFVRGEFVAVYDAEDLPERDQIRKAVAAFRAGPPDLACLQGRLNIYNPEKSWLTRQFTLEYSALFDGLLPTLDHYGLPIPLGGTSNHFRLSALRWLSAWDAYNVTEDADLGIRLARAGYRCGTLASTTYEEAPARLWAWVKQRTRWMKGYLQTWLVHMGRPVALWRELGPKRFAGFQLMVGGTLLSVLIHPWFYALAGYDLLRGAFFAAPANLLATPLWGLALLDVTIGYGAAMALGFAAARRRGAYRLIPHVALMPLYWLLISFAAYRALWQFLTGRFTWEKTEHGEAG